MAGNHDSGQCARCALDDFIGNYFSKKPFSNYISMCGLSVLGRHSNVSVEQRNIYCILVRLSRPLPEGIVLPAEYKGIPLLIEIIGKIYPLCAEG